MKYKYALLAVLTAFFLCGYTLHRFDEIKRERDRYKANTEALMRNVRLYVTRDSLNAAEVDALTLTLAEYKKYNKEEAKKLATLDTKRRNLEQVISAQSVMLAQVSGEIRDSIVYRDERIMIRDTLRCIDISDGWIELHGCANKQGKFDGWIESNDTLLAAVTIKHKRFLGFLWRTKKIKDKKLDIVSSNPHTRIADVHYIIIN